MAVIKPRWKWNTVQEMLAAQAAEETIVITDGIEERVVYVQEGELVFLEPTERVMH